MEINNDFEIKKKRIEVKDWKCPKCGFLTSNEEMQLIVFEPKCRCYNRTGMTWGNFVPVIEEKSKKYRTWSVTQDGKPIKLKTSSDLYALMKKEYKIKNNTCNFTDNVLYLIYSKKLQI